MTKIVRSFVEDRWVEGTERLPVVNPATEESIGEVGIGGVDLQGAFAHGRRNGVPALGKLSFAERGRLLQAISKCWHGQREALLDLAVRAGGNTRSDAKFDVDGAIGTVAHYGKLGEKLGGQHWLADGEAEKLLGNPRFIGQHVWGPRQGLAVHINAFNFPAWGFGEKAAVALLAGMPVLIKAAPSTAIVTEHMVDVLVQENILPTGAVAFLPAGESEVLEPLGAQDVVAFTGSAATAAKVRAHARVLASGARVNVEADSLNAAVLGPDVDRDSDTYGLLLRELTREMTQKAGQKCTALRRIFVPHALMDSVCEDLAEQLGGIKVGDPSLKEVDMGPLDSAEQLQRVRQGVAALAEQASFVLGDGQRCSGAGVGDGVGYFIAPTLLRLDASGDAGPVHQREVFGPVATVIAYDGTPSTAARQVALADGALVNAIYSDDQGFVQEAAHALAPFSGRIHLGMRKTAEQSASPGMVLPQLTHGGPGRAGAGTELGGERGLQLYMQRTALQGYAPMIERLS